jgi:PKD repeat protein
MVNHDITFDASNSTDDNNGIVSYSWDFQDDGIFDALGQVTAFSYTNAGTYTVRLRLTDTLGRTADATRVVTVTFGGGGATLSLTIHGAGNGVVTLLPDQGACSYSGNFGPTTCSYQYPTGTFITLTATAYSGSVVGDWVHCDSISADGLKCFVSLSANRSINVFILPLSP